MEGSGFRLVCASCLATRDVLASERRPEACPDCGAHDPWTGPVAGTRFLREPPEHLIDSPFYMAAGWEPRRT